MVTTVLTNLRYASVISVATLLAACGGENAADSTQQPAQSADFVREFYGWYATHVQNQSGPGWYAALSKNPPILDDRLLELLRADSAAQAAAMGEVMGIDWDPFLATQDPCEAFEIQNVTEDANGGRIEVRTSCYYVDSLPDVVAQVVRRGNGLVFTNFTYPREHTDLLKILGMKHAAGTASR